MKNVDVMIGIPCFDRKLYVETAVSITNTIVELAQLKVGSSIFNVSGCGLITHARNAVVAEFMVRRNKTHLLFVDADMEWTPHTIVRMLKADAPFVAAPYAKKAYPNVPISNYQAKDLNAFHAAALDWNVEFDIPGVFTGESRLVEVRPGFAKAKRIAAGLMLLRRDMLEKMILTYAETEYKWDRRSDDNISNNARYFGLFDLAKDETGRLLGEDYAFCDRWVKGCGGEILCDVNARVGHHGHHRYSASLNESLLLRGRSSGSKGST